MVWDGKADAADRRMLRRWLPMFQPEIGSRVEEVTAKLEARAIAPLQIKWRSGMLDTSSSWFNWLLILWAPVLRTLLGVMREVVSALS